MLAVRTGLGKDTIFPSLDVVAHSLRILVGH